MPSILSRLLLTSVIIAGVAAGIPRAPASDAAAAGRESPVGANGTVLPRHALYITSVPSQHMTDPTTSGFGTTTTDSRQVTLLEVINNPKIVVPEGGGGSPGKPGTVVPPSPGMRWIGLKFTVTSTTTCSGFSETRDFCLILPGVAQTVNSQDVNLPIDDVMQGCRSVYQTPHGQGILQIGQSANYCSAVLVPSNAKVTAITYADGAAKPLRWNVTSQAPRPGSRWTCKAAQANHWSGRGDTTPPDCDNNGAFRRVYSPPGQYAAKATVTLPPANLTLPPGEHPLHGDTGFIYLEGWPGPGKTNFEAGLQYSPLHNWYTFYTRPADPSQPDERHHFPAGDTVTISISPYSGSAAARPKGCRTASLCIIATVSDARAKEQRAYNVSWAAGPSFIYARMTTIGQKPANDFTDGAAFGPVAWSSARLATVNSSKQITWSSWHGGGSQNWPPDRSRIVVVNAHDEVRETDLIDLYP